ncbi:MAG TPA: methyltransferase domain-containing protein [Thermoanaerobaculia bacterium]|nr:methyltransferase domain-containing protein [Thermoanaerobaculia bacterium]
MEARFQRRIQRYGWDKAASCYEELWGEQLLPARERLLASAALAPGERVVDIACGTGLVTFPAAAAVGREGEVVATDLSQEMVDRVRARAGRQGFPQVTAERMDSESLALRDESFDAALNCLGLMYAPEPLQALREMHRILRPAGRAVAAVWGERRRCGWADIFPIVDARVRSEVCPMFFQLGSGDLLAESFAAAGFTAVTTHRVEVTLRYDSGADALGAAFAAGPVALAYSRFDGATRDAAHGEYLASIAPFQRGEGYDIPGEFVVTGGRRP